MANYHGIELAAEEVVALEELEELLRDKTTPEKEEVSLEEAIEELMRIEIPLVKKIKKKTFGYKVEEGKIVEIGLHNKRLTTLPESLSKLSLEKINLKENEFVTIPSKVSAKICSIRNWEWKNLKGTDLKAIQDLSIIIEKKIPLVEEMKEKTFGYKAEEGKVVKIGLHKKGLTTLPESLSKLTSIEKINLKNNKFVAIPSTVSAKICSIRNWEWKNLKGTDLNVIQELSIFINKKIPPVETIEEITEYIFGYYAEEGKIRGIGITGYSTFYDNRFVTLPEGIGDLTSLTILLLGYNTLKALPSSFDKLINLKALYLKGNNANILPEKAIQQLKDQGCEIIT